MRAAAQNDDTRARLLKAAVEIFAERGFENSTIREICSRAGANVALVNYYFGDKMELYTEVLRYSMQSGSPQIPKAPSSKPEHALRQVIKAMVERVLQSNDQAHLRYRLMMHEFIRPSSATACVVQEVMQPMYDHIREIAGKILALPPDHQTTRLCAHSVIGQVAYYARSAPMLRSLWPEMSMNAAQREAVAKHIADFSLAYLHQIAGSKVTPRSGSNYTKRVIPNPNDRAVKKRSINHGSTSSKSETSHSASRVEGTRRTL